jgi:hypothetical protein
MIYLSDYTANQLLKELSGKPFDAKRRTSRLVDRTYRDSRPSETARVTPRSVRESEWEIGPPGKFYLAGPMRGYPFSNFPAFLLATSVLRARGFEILSPAEKDLEAGFDPTKSAADQQFDIGAAFRWDFRILVDCRGIILLPGWERSTGATAERLVAQLSELEIYFLDRDFKLIEAPEMDYTLTWTSKAPAEPKTSFILPPS